MPSSSQKQHNLMELIAHGGKTRDGKGPPPAVAKEFVQADKGKTFKKPSPIASKSTSNRVKSPNSLVNLRTC